MMGSIRGFGLIVIIGIRIRVRLVRWTRCSRTSSFECITRS